MWIAIAVVAVLLVLSVWLTKVNDRYARKADGDEQSADQRVATAWEDFGLADDADQVRAAFDRLCRVAPVAELAAKESLVAMAVMAIRAERHEVLDALATRAEGLDAGCGETGALGVLAAAYAGDAARAQTLWLRSQQAMQGCASCGAGADTKILMQEVQIAMQALADGAMEGEGEGAKHAGDARREAGPAREGDPELAAPEAALERADAWVDRAPDSADAWLAKGVALARMGSLEVAERALARALERDRGCFPAVEARAAVAGARGAGSWERMETLGREALADGAVRQQLADMVEGWSALAERERVTLACLARPLGAALEALAESGARVRVVPVHVRAQDLELGGQGLGEVVLYDARAFDDAGVYATSRRVLLRWDALFGAPADREWIVARALAATAAQALPAEARAELGEAAGAEPSPAALADVFADRHVAQLRKALGLVEGGRAVEQATAAG